MLNAWLNNLPERFHSMHFIYAHLVGDYLLQNDYMAKGKKNSNLICTLHIVTYMLPFLLCNLSPIQFCLIAAQHWIQDRTNIILDFCKYTGKSDFIKSPMGPWSIIIVDNIFHILWMAFIINLHIYN